MMTLADWIAVAGVAGAALGTPIGLGMRVLAVAVRLAAKQWSRMADALERVEDRVAQLHGAVAEPKDDRGARH